MRTERSPTQLVESLLGLAPGVHLVANLDSIFNEICDKNVLLFPRVLNALVIPPVAVASVTGLAPLHFRRRAT